MHQTAKTDLPVYHFRQGTKLVVTQEIKKDFWENGFIIVRNLLTRAEVAKLKESLEAPSSALMANAYDVGDGDGRCVKMVLWKHPGDDVTGMINRSERIVDTCESLMGGEVYHYHSKMVMKDAFTGGAFQWHQDYGYWYLNGILRPNLISVQFAVDKMDMGNGCLQVLRGSHQMGRIDHGKVGGQAGADNERVKEAAKVFERLSVELDEGDGLIFHCNLLHRSNQNASPRRRWSLIACYNRADNDSYKEHHCARYTPIRKVPDSAVMECTNPNDVTGKEFVNQEKDRETMTHLDLSEETEDGQTYGK